MASFLSASTAKAKEADCIGRAEAEEQIVSTESLSNQGSCPEAVWEFGECKQ